MNENAYQPIVIKRLRELFPECIILKNDPNVLQGFPDLTILYNDKWATLETKKSRDARKRPNQAYYQRVLNRMSFSAFIQPENEEEVLRDLQQTLRP